MALVTRARATGILSLCLLLLSSLSATGALASAAPPQIAAPQLVAIVVGTNSCIGTDACLNAVGPIGDNSCIGDYSCKDTTGSIGSDSCVGISGSTCTGATANIGANSCNGAQTCGNGTGSNNITSVGDNSCNGGSACIGKAGAVGDGSCDGNAACLFSTGNIGDNSCTGDSVCYGVAGAIGNNSCNGSSACNNSTANVGNNSCNGTESCVVATATVGNNSCNGSNACDRISTAVGDCANNVPGSVPAACGGTYRPDARIRFGSGTFVGNHIYNLDATGQSVLRAKPVNEFISFFVQVVNTSPDNLSDRFKVKRSAGYTDGYRVRYYDAHGRDVTGQVNTNTFVTPTLARGEKYTLLAKVKVRPHATACSFTSRLMTVTSVNDPTKKDAVRFTAELETAAIC